MTQPSITYSGFTLHEPVTVLTDLMLSAVGFYYSIKTRKSHAKLWSVFFLILSLATLAGALGHGLYTGKDNGFQLTARCLGLASVMIAEMAALRFDFMKPYSKLLQTLFIFQFLTALTLLLRTHSFRIVAVNGTIGMGIIVSAIHLIAWRKDITGSNLILLGILINAIAGIVHKFALAPHIWFNHNDLAHVLMIFGLMAFAKGAQQLQQYHGNT